MKTIEIKLSCVAEKQNFPIRNDVCGRTQIFATTYAERGYAKQRLAFDGIRLAPALKSPQADVDPRALYWHYPHYYPTTTPVSAIRQGDWKLLEFLEDNHIELYNLKEDVEEKNNLAKANPQKAQELLELLGEWRRQVDAPMPQSNPDYANTQTL